MAEVLSSRERVLRTLNHEEPDRVPLGIGSSGSAISDGIYFQLKDRLGIEGDISPWRYGHGDNYYDTRIFDALNTDIRHVCLGPSDRSILKMREDEINEWGVRIEKVGPLLEMVSNPLEHATLADLDDYPWPDPYDSDSWRIKGLRQAAKDLFENGDFAIATRSPSRGLFETALQLRGFQRFMLDLMIDKKFAHKLVGKILDVLLAFYDVLLSQVGDYVHIVETQDDYGTQESTLLSPELFREFFKGPLKRLSDLIRSKAPRAKIYFHSCGAVSTLIEDFIDLGIDILNPVQPLAKGMDTKHLKARFGDRIVFYGGIDLQRALIGTPEDVDREVRRRICDLAPGGGYILAPANLVTVDIPVDNVLLLCELALKYGRYPIDTGQLCGES